MSSICMSILGRSLSRIGSILEDEIFSIYTRKRQKLKKIAQNALKLVDKQPEITRNRKFYALRRCSTLHEIFEDFLEKIHRQLSDDLSFLWNDEFHFQKFFHKKPTKSAVKCVHLKARGHIVDIRMRSNFI